MHAMNQVALQDANHVEERILTFTLGAEEYGLDILQVQEIRNFGGVTRLPGVPRYIKGLIDLRGTIVPVMDLRARLDPEDAHAAEPVMVVLNHHGSMAALLVDAVSDVVALDPVTVRGVPNTTSSARDCFVSGLVTLDERMIILLDVAQLMGVTGLLEHAEAA